MARNAVVDQDWGNVICVGNATTQVRVSAGKFNFCAFCRLGSCTAWPRLCARKILRNTRCITSPPNLHRLRIDNESLAYSGKPKRLRNKLCLIDEYGQAQLALFGLRRNRPAQPPQRPFDRRTN